ncbi:hypothetical protein TH53_06885 [Pedobacter lusitanus]|uniref:MbtH-like domain-containing protein n=1 Tax=Pedobacter lusitanus TaxID=1503925 RepID=A0A0D0GU18_9SPHI|nr:MbtH family NRPS accessory protein [Pedobacter lusitanus]KIO77856.1 hypothetical protein TH53_06885 [Pedobacter lusitanus]
MSSNTAIKDDETKDPFTEYFVVKSINEQYSVWPSEKEIPAGWNKIEIAGNKENCLDWIEKNWEGPKL